MFEVTADHAAGPGTNCQRTLGLEPFHYNKQLVMNLLLGDEHLMNNPD